MPIFKNKSEIEATRSLEARDVACWLSTYLPNMYDAQHV